MPICFASINSGSNGNCYYIGDEEGAVLIDAGVHYREAKSRLTRMGLSLDRVKAIFISHEHTDHTMGTRVISRRYGIPVYITEATFRNSELEILPGLLRDFRAHEPVKAGNLEVTAFPKSHDASDPHSFIVTGGGYTVGVFTDLGEATGPVSEHFSRCHAAFLESNYDEKMLEEGSYPEFLKRRIHGSQGHLSNRQALEIFLQHRPPHMSHLLLSHLSQDNNDPELVRSLFGEHAGGVHIDIASRHGESAVYWLPGNGERKPEGRKPEEQPLQMKLF